MLKKAKLIKNYTLNRIGFKRPLALAHLITQRCNSRCTFCSYWKHGNIKREMSTEQIIKLIDQAHEMGVSSYAITGGEPLLRGDIGQILHHASKNASMMTLLVTNGFLLEKRIDEVINYCTSIVISLDTLDPENYKRIRSVDAFDRVLSAIDCVIEKKRTTHPTLNFNINTVINENNLHELGDLVKFAYEKGIGITFEPVSPQIEIPETCLTIGKKDKFKKAVQNLLELKRGKYKKIIWVTETYLKNLLIWKPFRCLPHLMIRVDDAGDVTIPCYELTNKKVIGNVLKTPLREIYNQKANYKYWDIGKNCKHPGCFLLCYYEPSLCVQSISYALEVYTSYGTK